MELLVQPGLWLERNRAPGGRPCRGREAVCSLRVDPQPWLWPLADFLSFLMLPPPPNQGFSGPLETRFQGDMKRDVLWSHTVTAGSVPGPGGWVPAGLPLYSAVSKTLTPWL